MATESLSISVDSRFRDDPDTSTDSLFRVTLPNTYRNVTRIELVSAEIPIYSYTFSTNETTIFQVRRGPDTSGGIWTHTNWNTIVLPTGNYTSSRLASEIQQRAGTALGFAQTDPDPENQGFVVTADPETGRIQMYLNLSSAEWGTSSVTDMSTFDIQFSPVDLNAAYTYGVAQGYITPGTTTTYLEEIQVYASALRTWSASLPRGTLTLRDLLGFADWMIYGLASYNATDHFGLFGYPYMLLQVNDYDAIDHITGNGILKCIGKLSLDERGNDNGPQFGGGYAFSHSSDAVTYPKCFDQPVNVPRLYVRLLSPTGEVVDLLGSHLSFTLRIQYIRDSRQYDENRNSYIPSGPITSAMTKPGASQRRKRTTKLRNVRFTT